MPNANASLYAPPPDPDARIREDGEENMKLPKTRTHVVMRLSTGTLPLYG